MLLLGLAGLLLEGIPRQKKVRFSIVPDLNNFLMFCALRCQFEHFRLALQLLLLPQNRKRYFLALMRMYLCSDFFDSIGSSLAVHLAK